MAARHQQDIAEPTADNTHEALGEVIALGLTPRPGLVQDTLLFTPTDVFTPAAVPALQDAAWGDGTV